MAQRGDSFDYLPDSILCFILSFLTFKEAARTCILSKRWTNLWTSTTNIELVERNFMEEVGGVNRPSTPLFIAFAQRFIESYQGNKIERFRLCMSNANEFHSLVDGWIRFALSREVEHIDLEFSEDALLHEDHLPFEIPSIEFENPMLTDVRLKSCVFNPEDLTKFRSVKYLHVECAIMTTKGLQYLIEHLHFLHSLTIKRCRGMDHVDIHGRNHPLSRLIIEDCGPIRGVSISLPNLLFYKYFGRIHRYDSLDLNCAVEVDLNLEFETDFDNLGETISDILCGLDNVQTLKVCRYILQVLPSSPEPFQLSRSLSQVTHLIFRTSTHPYELPGIACLLRSCPHLETVTFEMGPPLYLTNFQYSYGPVLSSKQYWASRMKPIKCFGRHLKTIRIENFEMHVDVMELVKFLLEKARVLQNVIFVTPMHTPWSGWSVLSRKTFFLELFCRPVSPTAHVFIS